MALLIEESPIPIYFTPRHVGSHSITSPLAAAILAGTGDLGEEIAERCGGRFRRK
jgi:hypothetical protein